MEHKNKDNKDTFQKKAYTFGDYEVLDFDSLVSSFSQDLNNLAIYARIPAPPADCSDSMPADFCMSPF